MKLALIQQHAGPDRAENLARGLAALSEAAAAGADLAVFAELAFEPFHPQRPAPADPAELAEAMDGPTVTALREFARRHQMVVVPNFYELDRDQTYDCSPVIDADGALLGSTRMVHVPDYDCFHERGYYAHGDCGAPVFDTAVGRVGVAICYDRHFPEYTRALALAGAELVLVPQAGAVDEWPEGLYEAEMRVVSFQNGYFTALCNRVGKEEHIHFAGESFVCDPAGCVVARAGQGTDEVLYCDIDLAKSRHSHARRLFLADRRPSTYRALTEES